MIKDIHVRKKRAVKANKAVSLVELIITTILISIVFAVIIFAVVTPMRYNAELSVDSGAVDELLIASKYISQNIRSANFLNLSDLGDIQGQYKQIQLLYADGTRKRYIWDDTDNTIVYYASDAADAEILSDNITSCYFSSGTGSNQTSGLKASKFFIEYTPSSGSVDPFSITTTSSCRVHSGNLYVDYRTPYPIDQQLGTKNRPFKQINQAINAAGTGSLATIHVAQGIYKYTDELPFITNQSEEDIEKYGKAVVFLEDNMHLLGGYEGLAGASFNWGARDPEYYDNELTEGGDYSLLGTYYTAIDGENPENNVDPDVDAIKCISIIEKDNVVIDGFYIQNGLYTNDPSRPGAGGITIYTGSGEYYAPAFSKCVITKNSSIMGDSANGIYIFSTRNDPRDPDKEMIFDKCAIVENTNTAGHGCSGGFAVTGGDLKVTDSIINNNDVGTGAGGGWFYATYLYMENCTISNHTSRLGSGILTKHGDEYTGLEGFNMIFRNCKIDNNYCYGEDGGAGFKIGYHGASRVLIDNCEISNNTAFQNTPVPANRKGRGGGIMIGYRPEYAGQYADPNIVEIRNCNIHDNQSDIGGAGITSVNAQLTIENSYILNNTVSGNSDTAGGGIYAYETDLSDPPESFLHISNCRIENNQTDTLIASDSVYRGGGGVYCYNMPLTIDSSTIANNVAESGGSVAANGGGVKLIGRGGASINLDARIVNSKFSNNSSTESGGGVAYSFGNYIYTFLVDNCKFINNSCTQAGGGIHLKQPGYASPLTITDSTFSSNSAADGAGIASHYGNAEINIKRCLFKDNTAVHRGGALRCYALSLGDLNLKNSIFTRNTSNLYGGAVSVDRPEVVLVGNCVFYNNHSTQSSNKPNLDSGEWDLVKGGEAIRIHLESEDPDCCDINIYNTIFLDNATNYRGPDPLNTDYYYSTYGIMIHRMGTSTSEPVRPDPEVDIKHSVFYAKEILLSTGTSYASPSTSPYQAVFFNATKENGGTFEESLSNGVPGWGGWDESNCLEQDPEFVDTAGDNYNLAAGSDCIDAGDPIILDREDLPDNPGQALPPSHGTTRSDLGAYGGPDAPDEAAGEVIGCNSNIGSTLPDLS